MNYHQSSAYIHQFPESLSFHRSSDYQISKQARFVLRLAVTCAEKGIPYDLKWEVNGSARATIRVNGPCDLPMPKPFAKPKPERKVVDDWKPTPFEAVYSLEAYSSPNAQKEEKPAAGFVIVHSCGLSLVRAGESESGDLTERDNDDSVMSDWMIIHTRGGHGFGLCLPFKKAVKALLGAAGACDWTLTEAELKDNPAVKRAIMLARAEFGNASQKEKARRELEKAQAA